MPSARRRRTATLVFGALLAMVLAAWLAPELVVLALGSWVRGETGRSLAVDEAGIAWGRETTLHLRGVRLANARWARDPWMLSVDHVRLRVSPGELLRGRGILQVLEVSGAALLLEVRGDKANWEFEDRPSPFLAFGGGGLPAIQSLQLRDLRVRFHDPGLESDITGAIAGASGSLGIPGWEIRGQGTLDFKALRFQLQSRGEVVELALNLGDTALVARGSPASDRYFIEARGDDLRNAFPVIPIPFPSTPDYQFEAELVRDGDRAVLRGLHGRIGETDVAGELKLTLASPVRVEGQIHSRTLHLRDLKGFIGVPVRGPPPRPGKLFPATPINRQRFSRLRLVLDYHADAVVGGRVPIDRMATRVIIGQGELRLSSLRASVAGGVVRGSAGLDVRPETPHASLQLALEGARLGRLVARVPMLDASRGRVRGTLQLSGTGASLAEILDASRGELVVLMDQGALDRQFIDALTGDLLRLLFGDDEEEETARLACAVSVFNVHGGVARADALVAETSNALITGTGEVDLGRERLDLSLAAEPKETTLLAAPTPITVGGSLADPEISLEASELAGRAAAAVTLGALAGPLAALASFTVEGQEGGDCAGLLARIRKG